ncbi:MtrB/PioB family outer membrane beta-barrel protein [Dokdonella ginsengisoli]|uniref:MtrB/PioB family outer membrane beta-barrel protein n=1 Tax=Dokdonella ginsengisoli TaxID=363846 RepID=A0ABV9QWV8_9GAMM
MAHADSGVGVDTWRATKLDPTAGANVEGCDERGTSWLVPGQRRTPTGHRLACPPASAPMHERGDWRYSGVLQFGYLGTGGDDGAALWNRYAFWDTGPVLGLVAADAERADDGSYANLRATRVSDDDQYYQLAFGRAGSYRLQASLRDISNVLSANAKSIWNGVGTNTLTLSDGLTPGGSTPEQVAAVSAAASERTLKVKRSKQTLGYGMYLTPQWSAYANVSNEQRKGARPYGGTFFFNFPFPDNGGVFETVKPIDDSTIHLSAGLRYAGAAWRLDFGYSGSLYRDANRRYTFQTPYALQPVVPGSVSAPLTTGQMSTEPDNDYHNLKAALTRKLPLKGEFSLTASVGRMRQDDSLIAPVDCRGVFGIGTGGSLQPGPQNPLLYDCAQWNTPAALSRRSADMQIDTTLLDARLVLQPTADLSVRGGLRFNRDDYRNGYLMLNPLTGQYGYVSENGSQGSVVPGESGIWDAGAGASNLTRIRSLPLDLQTIDANLGADWKLGERNTLGATFAFERYEPTNRERSEVDSRSLKLNWINRSLDWLTLRASLTFLKQTGDRYDEDPYGFTWSSSLPGFVAPRAGVPAHTVDAMRKYDLSSRDQRKVNLMATLAPREDMTITASLRGDWNDYDARIGRQGYSTFGATLQWDWQPTPRTQASAYYGYDRSRLREANVNELNANGVDPRLGGATYPLAGRWWVTDTQHNRSAGANLRHDFGRARLDLDWSRLHSRGITAYSYASSLALAWADTVPNDDPGAGAFAPMRYRVDTLALALVFPIVERVSLRVFGVYERGRIDDWHYAGFDARRVIDHRVYTDGGPEDYSAHLVGVLLDVRL